MPDIVIESVKRSVSSARQRYEQREPGPTDRASTEFQSSRIRLVNRGAIRSKAMLDCKCHRTQFYGVAMVSPVAYPVETALARGGFAFVAGAEMAALLAESGGLHDWDQFRASWHDLPLDAFMADGGRYRRRRHAVYAATRGGSAVRQAHQPHYQSREYNPLNGGVARWFAPVDAGIGDGPTLHAILRCAQAIFERFSPRSEWRIEVHQFRIEARRGEQGQPTPEGVHRDGVDYVLVLLIDRVNIVSGTTTVHALNGEPLGSFTLTTALDAALLDDARVAHGVTAIEPLDAERSAYRDVLVVTFKQSRA